MNKVVLAYSGGLDTSVAVAWLKERYDAEVVTLTIDLGGGSLREGVEARAISAGAARAYVVDAKERFVTGFVWPHLQANALYQGAYPLATALARPLNQTREGPISAPASLLSQFVRWFYGQHQQPHRRGTRRPPTTGPLRRRRPRARPGPRGDRADAHRDGLDAR